MTTGGSVIAMVYCYYGGISDFQGKSKFSRFLYYFFIGGLIVPSQMVIVPIAHVRQAQYTEYPFYADDHVYYLFAAVFHFPLCRLYEKRAC